jgi:hypothetical protein
MKLFLKIGSFCFLAIAIANSVFAQNLNRLKRLDSIYRAAGDNAFYVINGRISHAKLDSIDHDEILDIQIIDKTAKGYVNKGERRGVIVVTRQFAIAQYQAKFSRFSKSYKNYITQYMKDNHNDNGIFYLPHLINDKGEFLSDDERIRKLYSIPEKDIRKVELTKQETCCGTNRTVTITMK